MRPVSWLAMLLVTAPLAAAGPSSPEKEALDTMVPDDMKLTTDEEKVAEVVRVFVETLQDTKASLLADMGTDPFNFDGRVVEGRKAIRDEWKKVFEKRGKSLQRSGKPGVELLDYPKAKARFGEPPAKFDPLVPRKCWFAAVTFPKRSGLVLIVTKDKEAGWLVGGVTD